MVSPINERLALFFLTLGCIVSPLVARPLNAQSANVSNIDIVNTPVPGSGHDYIKSFNETVNPVNGSLSLRIEAPFARPRGDITFPYYVFGYDSGGVATPSAWLSWNNLGSSLNINWLDSSMVEGGGTSVTGMIPGGFVANTGIGQLYSQYTGLYTVVNSTPPQLTATCDFYSNYTYIDPFANRHAMNVAWITQNGGSGGDEGCSWYGGAIPSGTSWGDAQYSVTLQSPSGLAYLTDTHGRGFGAEDTNGNIWNPNYYQGVTTTVVNNQITSVSVPGLANPYKITYGTTPRSYTPGSKLVGSNNTGCNLLSAEPSSSIVVKSITLPNSTPSNPQLYVFGYDSTYGLLNNITYPTGAYVSYKWGVNADSESLSLGGGAYGAAFCQFQHDWPAIQTRIVSFDGIHQALEQDFSYSQTTWGTGSGDTLWTQKTTTVTTKDCTRATSCSAAPSFKTIYTYSSAEVGFGLFAGQTAVENSIAYYDFDGSLLKTVTKNWNLISPPQLASECVTLPNGQTSGTFYTYAAYDVVSDKKEYDYGILSSDACAQGASPPTATPTRETTTSYKAFSATPLFPTPSIRDRPLVVQVYDHGALIAETDYAYDSYPNGVTSVTAVGHDDTNFPTSYTNRGNVTTKTVKCLQTTCVNAVTTYTGYDETGQILSSIDPNGNAAGATPSQHTTYYSYTDSWLSGDTYTSSVQPPAKQVNAYLTTLTLPPTSGVSHIETFSYDYPSGQLTASTDENRKTTNYRYDDYFARLTSTSYPDGGQTTTAYDDSPYNAIKLTPNLKTTKAITSTVNQVNTTAFDGLGHALQTVMSSDPDGATSTATTYDGTGMPYQVYNPTRCNPPTVKCGTGTTWGYITYTYDALGRTRSVLQPDSSTVQTTYSSNQSTVTDETGKSRKSVADALGRLTQVFEDPAGLNYETDYAYDALSNMLSVTQKGSNEASARYRTFTYDSLSRLLCAANPEVQAVTCPASANGSIPPGAITFGYDANGNLLTKTGPAPNLMAVPGTAGSGSASAGGAEQSIYHPAIAGSGTITLSGSEQSTPPTGSTGSFYLNFSVYLYLGASVSIVVNGSTAGTATVPKGSSGCIVAPILASAINGNSSSLVTASSSCPGNGYGAVQLSSKSTGSQTNYPVSCSGTICNLVSTNQMFGGTNGTPDTGKVSVTVNGFMASAQYGSGSTPGSIATALASALSASGSPVTGSANGSVVTIKATQSGAASNYPLSSAVTWNSQLFSKSSFTSVPSGSSLTGGVNAVSVYDSGTVWLAVNGCQASTTYGQTSTAAGLASTLANALNTGDCGVSAAATGSGIALAAMSTGSDTDYSLSAGSSTNLPAQFSSPSFTVTVSGSALSGGADEQVSLNTTTYTYDALNRPLSVTHTNPSGARAAWAYDGTAIPACPGIAVPKLTSPTYLIGRRSSMCSQESTSSFSYDSMGRIIAEIRSIGLNAPIITNATAYAYYKDGSLNALTYPSGDVVTYTVGGAGRVTQISDAANNFVVAPTTPPMYAPHGDLAAMTQGSGITTKNAYDVRLRPSLLSAGPSAGLIFNLNYTYYANGNVFQVIDNFDSTRSTSFSYDALNRLQGASTVNTTSANCWGEAYTIDPWGNLTNVAGASGVGGNCYTETLNAAPATTANHLNGYCYDAAGNVVLNAPCPTGTFTPTYYYDAENRLYNPLAQYTYFYDADGVRIRKAASATIGTMYWPSPSGQYLMETNGSGTINEEYIYFDGDRIARIDRPSGTVHYYFSDKLQSASLITDPSGNVQERYYYYPYGGLRTSTGSDSNHYKFTGKERDAESGLDEFGARYYGSSLGRFMTPDWATTPIDVPYANFGNPQSLNLYSYVNNNPTTTRDPDGHVAGVDDAAEALVFSAAVLTTAVVIYESQPQNQRNFAEATSKAFTNTVDTVKSWFSHPDNSGKAASPPGTTTTNVTTGTPASTSQQGAVDTSPAQMAGGPKAADAPGVTAGGQATDVHGNKLGPSGKPQVNETNSNTREGAGNRALNEGSGKVEHANPAQGQPHFHPADKQGNKKPTSTHHNYPD